jgi:hypothetical protein
MPAAKPLTDAAPISATVNHPDWNRFAIFPYI